MLLSRSAKSVLATLLLLLFVGLVHAKDPVRIDASSNESAQASWDRMTAEIDGKKNQQLQIAMVQLNLVRVNSASEVVSNPELQNLSVVRIKDKVAGLTADEIIELANRTSNVKVNVEVKPSGK
jgi:hypothetical protein